MRFGIITLLSGLIASAGIGQIKVNEYQYTIDLTRVVNDQVYVELKTPTLTTTTNETIFYLPKIIPGTYAIEDFGRYVNDLKAFDKKGKELEVEKTSTNSWKIKSASKLGKISYWMDDTFDTEKGDPKIFEPAGTNIEASTNFLLNNGGLFGYFDQLKNIPFQIRVIRDKELYGSTGLIAQQNGVLLKLDKENGEGNQKRADLYKTDNYDQLVDSPIMYAKADTAVIKVADTEVLIGSYSPNAKIKAKEIASTVRDVLMAQKEFLGGKLPVEKYAFIFYWTDKPVKSIGALEHSYSSVYHMPETSIDKIGGYLKDFVAHEFFHIVTPLTIHSEEIHQFDFNEPKMSKHLWLYEGVTEYFAQTVQVKYGLMSRDQYLDEIHQKLLTADRFYDEVPFTEISLGALDKYANQYYNVYQKGAIIGLCLDIKLRQLSKGAYGIQSLIADLSRHFGKSSAFKDDELFVRIASLTYPEIGEFLNRYVGGPEKLPLQEIFASVGIQYVREESYLDYSTGLETKAMKVVDHDGKKVYQINDPTLLNEQGKLFHLLKDDIIVSINGEEMPEIGPKVQAYFEKVRASIKDSATIQYEVLREDENGNWKKLNLEAPVKMIERKRKHVLEFDQDATSEQLALREAWLASR